MNDRPSSRPESVAWWSTFVLCGLILVAHFSLVQLGNMPMSPLKLELSGLISRYVSPYFAQRWNFFAPQPINRDTFVLCRGRYHDEKTDSEVETGWIDVSRPFIEAVRKNRLSPLFLVGLGLSNAVSDFENGLNDNKAATFEKDGKTYIKSNLPATIDPFNLGVITRTGLATLQLSFPGTKFDAVQVGLAHYTYPRFTERHDKTEAPQTAPITTIDWQPAGPVAPYTTAALSGGA